MASMRAITAVFRAGILLFALLAAGAGTAEAKRYSADRFDTRIQVLTDGSIRVT
jgi:hypothetical protein